MIWLYLSISFALSMYQKHKTSYCPDLVKEQLLKTEFLFFVFPNDSKVGQTISNIQAFGFIHSGPFRYSHNTFTFDLLQANL